MGEITYIEGEKHVFKNRDFTLLWQKAEETISSRSPDRPRNDFQDKAKHAVGVNSTRHSK
jgi:hypothetical protein